MTMNPSRLLSRLNRRLRPNSSSVHVENMRNLWNRLSQNSRLGYIAHLQPGAEWNEGEFAVVGERFVERITDRFEDHGSFPLSQSTVLEIGCGVGRFSRPLAERFKSVVGYDISAEMVEQARARCDGLENVRFEVNDGTSLGDQPDASVEYCVCAGVFQHITHIDIIAGYIHEALRVLAPGGVFLFQFEANRIAATGEKQVGARITAGILDDALRGDPYRIRECSRDSHDPVQNLVIVLEKTGEDDAEPQERSFRQARLIERGWISGIYDGVATRAVMHDRLAAGPRPMTFYED
jgi:SAM-dependent methyltransferase